MSDLKQPKEKLFSSYQVFIIVILATLNVTVILDFMVLSPLGEILMRQIHISPRQFGIVVAAYAISAGISGLVSAGFADKYDRKKLLIFFYTGFLVGTLLCAIAPGFYSLLLARTVTGIFGGVVGSVGGAIMTDLFKAEVRGRVMGFVQMAFSVSQVLGIPIGLALANRFDWHAPFWLIVIFGLVVGIIIFFYMKPVNSHLSVKHEHSAFAHLRATATNPSYVRAFLATTLLATGGFMMMPFASAFTTNNVGITLQQLPWLYAITGAFSVLTGPLIGKLSDKTGKYKLFAAGTALSAIMVIVYTNLGITPLWIVIALNTLMFVGIMSRMITSQALMMAVPEMRDRGAFMSINASTQYLAGGIASAIAGLIVVRTPLNRVEHYDILGYVVIGSMFVTVIMMYFLNRFVQQKMANVPKPVTPKEVVA